MTMMKFQGNVVPWDHDLPMEQFDQCEWASRIGRCGTPGAVLIRGDWWLCVDHTRAFIASVEGEADLAEHRLGLICGKDDCDGYCNNEKHLINKYTEPFARSVFGF